MKRIQMTITLLSICMYLPVHAGSLTVLITNEKKEPLPDAVIYLTSNKSQVRTAEMEFEIEQKNKMFNPFVTILPTGSKIMFPNRDGIGHHVYSFSPAMNFQLPLSERESTDNITFDKQGTVTVGCNIHDWMIAYIYIVDTALFAKSDTDGMAVIDNLPEGVYVIHVTHPGIKSTTAITTQIDVMTDTDVRLDYSLNIKPEYFWRPAHQFNKEEY